MLVKQQNDSQYVHFSYLCCKKQQQQQKNKKTKKKQKKNQKQMATYRPIFSQTCYSKHNFLFWPNHRLCWNRKDQYKNSDSYQTSGIKHIKQKGSITNQSIELETINPTSSI